MRPEVEALKDHPHFGALFGQLAVTDIAELTSVPGLADQPVADVDVPAGRAFEVIDAAQQRRLARATGADDGDRLAGIDIQIDAFEHLVGAEALVQVDHSEERFHYGTRKYGRGGDATIALTCSLVISPSRHLTSDLRLSTTSSVSRSLPPRLHRRPG